MQLVKLCSFLEFLALIRVGRKNKATRPVVCTVVGACTFVLDRRETRHATLRVGREKELYGVLSTHSIVFLQGATCTFTFGTDGKITLEVVASEQGNYLVKDPKNNDELLGWCNSLRYTLTHNGKDVSVTDMLIDQPRKGV